MSEAQRNLASASPNFGFLSGYGDRLIQAATTQKPTGGARSRE
jgi:hypothetical protein